MSTSVPTALGNTRTRRASRYLADLWARREFAVALGLGNLKARNASTSLGLLWWVLNPILLGAVYFIVFGLLFSGRRPDDFLPYLLSGMFAFHFTSQSMSGGSNSIIQNAKLLANLRFPRLILPISALLESLVGFLASLAVLVGAVWISGVALNEQFLTYRLLLLPAILPIHILFNLGLATLASRLAVPFRDIGNLIPYLSRIWLYTSPVIWPLTFLNEVSDTVQTMVRLNPMFSIISLYRTAFLGRSLVFEDLWMAGVWSVVVGCLGVAVFVRYEGHIARHL